MKLGVIDVGTNSCRLLIMENTDRGWREIKKDLIITRLGEGVDKNGQLNEKAMLRTFKAIYRFLAEMDEAGVKKKTIIGTSALRDVSNADILLELLRTKTGLGIDIIDGEKETYLNYLGAGNEYSLLIDIGGGSTELIWKQSNEIVFKSINMGAVRMTERYITNPASIINMNELEEMRNNIKGLIKEKLSFNIKKSLNSVAGMGGTITTIGAIDQRLEEYQPEKIEGYTISLEKVKDILCNLSAMILNEKKKVPGLQPGRADIIIAGVVILESIMNMLEIQQLTITEHDLLYGVIRDIYGR